MNEIKEVKELEEQVVEWSRKINEGNEKELLQVIAELSVASYMAIWNINDNISLIRDMIASKLK